MENVLQKLESSKFINHIHKQVIVADTVDFLDKIPDNKDKFKFIKLFKPDSEYLEFMDLRIKSSIILSGFYDCLNVFNSSEADNVMMSCNIADLYTFIAFKDIDEYESIVSDVFFNKHVIPLHLMSVDLDYKLRIHILMYNNYFKLPGFNLN